MTSYKTETEYPDFHYDHDQYLCCCGIHVKEGAKRIGIAHAVLIILAIFSAAANRQANLEITIVASALQILCIVFLFLGIDRERPSYLWPYIAYTFFILLLLGLGFLLSAYAMIAVFSQSNRYQDNSTTMLRFTSFILAAVCALTIALHSWWLSVVCRCKQYLAHLVEHKRTHSSKAEGALL